MIFYYTYDNQGFEAAKHFSLLGDPINLKSLEGAIGDANHDLYKGFCQSFQFYLSTGELVLNSEFKRAA